MGVEACDLNRHHLVNVEILTVSVNIGFQLLNQSTLLRPEL